MDRGPAPEFARPDQPRRIADPEPLAHARAGQIRRQCGGRKFCLQRCIGRGGGCGWSPIVRPGCRRRWSRSGIGSTPAGQPTAPSVQRTGGQSLPAPRCTRPACPAANGRSTWRSTRRSTRRSPWRGGRTVGVCRCRAHGCRQHQFPGGQCGDGAKHASAARQRRCPGAAAGGGATACAPGGWATPGTHAGCARRPVSAGS